MRTVITYLVAGQREKEEKIGNEIRKSRKKKKIEPKQEARKDKNKTDTKREKQLKR